MTRIAIMRKDRCFPAKCNKECITVCPVNRSGKDCVLINKDINKAAIIEELCSGCGLCRLKCPFSAINIINLPAQLKEKPVHRYGKNAFELFRLPVPKRGAVVGVLGRNGIGKSTALNILSGNLKPNFGELEKQASDEEIIKKYATTSLGDYFKKLFSNKIKISYKPQRIELLPQFYKGDINSLIKKADERGIANQLLSELDLMHIKSKKLSELSGGELQRLSICAACAKDADFYYFDEPASFCDITQRVKIAKMIKSLPKKAAVMVVEHDLATLDYVSDEIQIIYGEAGAYGVISQSKGVRRGINEYLNGHLPDENLRFRNYSIVFPRSQTDKIVREEVLFTYPDLKKSLKTFSLDVKSGSVHSGEVLAVTGANGLGKTTFLRMLAGELIPDEGKIKKISIAYKPQYLPINVSGTVELLLRKLASSDFNSGEYKTEIINKLGLNRLLTEEIKSLSGGELQKVCIAATLSTKAQVYAFDEPSAFIDVEDRLSVAEVIKNFVSKKGVAAIVVDHDIQFVDYISSRILVFEGVPGQSGHVYTPYSKEEGINLVLKKLDITYRKDKETNRPQINKPGSQLDKTQKLSRKYYYF